MIAYMLTIATLFVVVILVMFFLKSTVSNEKVKVKVENNLKQKKITKSNQEPYENIIDDGLMSKVKRLKLLYNNGTLTKDEFEKAKNKLLT